jgi:putative oxidoreductase
MELNMNRSNPRFQGAVALVGRLLLTAIFVVSGLGKVADPATTIGYLKAVGMPLPVVAFWLTVLLEAAGGLMLFVGYRVRPIAAALAIFSVVAAVLFHGQFGDQNQFAHFLKNISMSGGLLLMVAFGAGSLSLDNRREKVVAPRATRFA